ncbi:MAG TPA: hypothetical protein DD745_07040 [Bacteroidales bacterium]|nr:hypothetical protein [Bacteroidales bacterium]HCU18987.1 hypothetical protein [Bacteroidales bacterium]
MMKKLSVLLLVVMISFPAFSQVKFGIKAGAETTTVPTYDISSGTNNIEALEDASWGFHGGIFMRIKLLALFVQPELVFASNTFDYTVETATVTEVKSQTFNRISVPLLVGLKLGPLRLNAGPAASIQIGSPEALIDDPNFENMYKASVWGFQAGIGLDILNKLTLDARYAGGLGEKFGDAVTIGGQNFQLDYSQKSFLLSAGWMF